MTYERYLELFASYVDYINDKAKKLKALKADNNSKETDIANAQRLLDNDIQSLELFKGRNPEQTLRYLEEQKAKEAEAKELLRQKKEQNEKAQSFFQGLGNKLLQANHTKDSKDASGALQTEESQANHTKDSKDFAEDTTLRTNKTNNTNRVKGLKDAAKAFSNKKAKDKKAKEAKKRKESADNREKRIKLLSKLDGRHTELHGELIKKIPASGNTVEDHARLEELIAKKNLSTLYAQVLEASLKKPLPKRKFAEPNELQKKAENKITSGVDTNKKTRNKDYNKDVKQLNSLFNQTSFNNLKSKAHSQKALSEYMKDYENSQVDDQVIKELKERNALVLAPLRAKFVNRAIKNNSMAQPSYAYAMNDLESIRNKMDSDSIHKYEAEKFIKNQKLAKDQMESDRGLVDSMASRKEGNINYLRSARKENEDRNLRDISNLQQIGQLRQQREQQRLDEERTHALLEEGREKHVIEDMNRMNTGKTALMTAPEKIQLGRTEVVPVPDLLSNIVGAAAQVAGNVQNERQRQNRFQANKATGGHIYQNDYPTGTPTQYKKRTLQDIIAETQQQQPQQEQEPEKNKWWDSNMWNAMSAMIAGQNKGGIGGISEGYQGYIKQQDANEMARGALAQKILASRAMQAQKAMEWEQKKRDFEDKSEDRQLRRAETAKYHDISLAQQAAKIALAKEKQQGDIEKSSNQMSEADKNLHKYLLGVMKASEKSFFPSSAAAKAKKTLSLYNSGTPLSQAYETVHNPIKSAAGAGNPKTINKSLEAKIAAAQRS